MDIRKKHEKLGRFIDDILRVFHARPILFSVIWGAVFVCFFLLGLFFGLIPDLNDTGDGSDVYDTVVTSTTVTSTTADQQRVMRNRDVVGDEPIHIVIDAIGVDSPILNPQSRDVAVLDQALLEGVVHYPGSGDLEDTSNMFLFGHSTGFRVVQNQAFKALNNLKDLKENDLIRVRSKDKEYLYKVQTVRLVNADEAFVELTNKKKMLTLSTCNTFGQKQERYVVEASYLSSYILTTR